MSNILELESVTMSDVYSTDPTQNDCGEIEPVELKIIAITFVSLSLVYVLLVFLITYFYAKGVAQVIAAQALTEDSDKMIPDVIVIEKDTKDQTMGRQTSIASIYRTVNSTELEKFYDKLPDSNKTMDSLKQLPRSARNSRHSSVFPPVLEDATEPEVSQTQSIPRIDIQDISSHHGSISSLRTPSFGTIPRKNNLVRMSSQEKVNQLTRFLLLNEDVDLFKESPASTRRGSSATSSRKLSIDYLLNNFLTSSHHPSKEDVIQTDEDNAATDATKAEAPKQV